MPALTAAPHIPVLCDRVVEILAPAVTATSHPPVIVDATVGAGGHTKALAEAFPQARIIGIDRDPEAIALAGSRLEEFGDRITLVHATFDRIDDVIAARRADAILFDLGVSSMQLDQAERGFAYATDAVLDMRMDPTEGESARDILATAPQEEIARILKVHGDEPHALRIARAIVACRRFHPLQTTGELADLVRQAIPAPARRTGGNPAKRTFQALRIEVNDELDLLTQALPAAITSLAVGGRIAVLSYHSGEDRIVKRALSRAATSTAPPGIPIEKEETKPYLRLLTRGGERPSPEEEASNPRAASARLRAAEKIREVRP
ncbi:MAG: 16S rRNA (cytosine(1402)-N(4))-methyltransferase RsmH [Micrococcales bacterium]|nr:16S rRNA (cytosine(1402)-N(4))-methyltransferase RsmH [Micrococcales bacterium]